MRYARGDCVRDRYDICAFLGEGSSAEVYRAEDRTTGRDVVLKLPRLTVAGDLVAYKRYRAEIDILAGLHGAGLQQLLSGPSEPFMVLEYVEGESLRTYLRRCGPLPVDQVVAIGLQLAATLEYVHEQGVIHRDIKPENVLIGAAGQVTLTDFGIAMRLTSRRFALSHLSNAVGTPDYMAPEQVRGARGDARTDVYSLGVLLYELLTGAVPYPADARVEHHGARTDPPLVRSGRPDAPEFLEAILYRALRRRPAERYASMAAVGADLSNPDSVSVANRYERDEPPPAPPGDLPPWSTTLRILALVAGVLLVVGFAAQTLHRGLASP